MDFAIILYSEYKPVAAFTSSIVTQQYYLSHHFFQLGQIQLKQLFALQLNRDLEKIANWAIKWKVKI